MPPAPQQIVGSSWSSAVWNRREGKSGCCNEPNRKMNKEIFPQLKMTSARSGFVRMGEGACPFLSNQYLFIVLPSTTNTEKRKEEAIVLYCDDIIVVAIHHAALIQDEEDERKQQTAAAAAASSHQKMKKSAQIATEIQSLESGELEKEAPARGYAPHWNNVWLFELYHSPSLLCEDWKKQSLFLLLPMTAIQNACIPHALPSRDILGAAKNRQWQNACVSNSSIGDPQPSSHYSCRWMRGYHFVSHSRIGHANISSAADCWQTSQFFQSGYWSGGRRTFMRNNA